MNKNTQIRINCKKCGSSIVRNSNAQKYCYRCAKLVIYYKHVPKHERISICVICKTEFIGRQKNQKICKNPFCREEYYMSKFKKHYFKIKDLKKFIAKYNTKA